MKNYLSKEARIEELLSQYHSSYRDNKKRIQAQKNSRRLFAVGKHSFVVVVVVTLLSQSFTVWYSMQTSWSTEDQVRGSAYSDESRTRPCASSCRCARAYTCGLLHTGPRTWKPLTRADSRVRSRTQVTRSQASRAPELRPRPFFHILKFSIIVGPRVPTRHHLHIRTNGSRTCTQL